MEKAEKKVIVIGSLHYDITQKQKRLPHVGETFIADSVTYAGGGKGANQAVQSAKLGIPTYIVGCIGNDMEGIFLRSSLTTFGVHTNFLRMVNAASGMSVAQVMPDGEVYCTIVHGANNCITNKDIDQLNDFLIPGDLVLFQLEIPIPVVEYAVRFCHKKGCQIILNAAPAALLSEEALYKTDFFIVNEEEAQFYVGEEVATQEDALRGARIMSQKYRNTCIFTLGKNGSVVSENGKCEVIPSIEVNTVETNGAGDSFIGGLCYGLAHDMNVFDASRLATCCSAITVCGIGCQPSMPTFAQLKHFMDCQSN